MSVGAKRPFFLAGFGVALAALAVGAGAQEVGRTAVVVDYVGVEGVYLPIGTDGGAEVGDTLLVYTGEGDLVALGSLVITAAARSRSVATMVAPGFPLERGDSIYLPLAPVRAAAVPAVAAETRPTPSRAAPRASTSGGPRVSGRLSFDVDVRETRTSWSGEDLFGTTRRRFATPVSSLSLRVSELPGGFRMETNLRGSYRYSDGVSIQPATSIRIYNLALVKEADAAPFEMRLGRFYNPHEPYSSYWDGALLRFGSRNGPGIGVLAGFEPERANEGFSSDVPKVTGFADYRKRGRSWSYATDVSIHYIHPQDSLLARQTFVGWSQQLSLGRFSLSQRLRLDRDTGTGGWALAQLRLRAGVPLGGPLRAFLGFGRTRPGVIRGEPLVAAPERDEVSAGLSFARSGRSLSLEVGSNQWADEERGISLSGAVSQNLGAILAYVSGRHWSRAGMTSLGVAPGFSFTTGWLATRIGYQMYRTETTQTLTSHSASVEFTATPARAFWIMLGGEEQWGGHFGGTRIRASVGHNF